MWWCHNKNFLKYIHKNGWYKNKTEENSFKSLKLFNFHKKYECSKDVSEIKYIPIECSKCENVYTSQKNLLKHEKKCGILKIKKVHNIKQLENIMIGDLWKIVFEYIIDSDINVFDMCQKNNEDILNCLYIKDCFSFKSIRDDLPIYMKYMFEKNGRTKLIKKWIIHTCDYIPSILEYAILKDYGLLQKIGINIILKNIKNDKNVYRYIVEDFIINNIIGRHPRNNLMYQNNDIIKNIINVYIGEENYENIKDILIKYVNLNGIINNDLNEYLQKIINI